MKERDIKLEPGIRDIWVTAPDSKDVWKSYDFWLPCPDDKVMENLVKDTFNVSTHPNCILTIGT